MCEDKATVRYVEMRQWAVAPYGRITVVDAKLGGCALRRAQPPLTQKTSDHAPLEMLALIWAEPRDDGGLRAWALVV